MARFDAEARRALLARTQLFASLPPTDLDAIAARAAVRRAARNDVILRRGDPNAGMVVIMSGRVRISLVSEDGKEVTLTVLGSGDVLGEMSLLDGEPVSADVTAQEDCVLLVIDRAQFLTLLRGSSDICLHLMALLSRRLRSPPSPRRIPDGWSTSPPGSPNRQSRRNPASWIYKKDVCSPGKG